MNILNQKKGFTLVEALVAISILSMAITGPLLIAQKGISASIYARDQITAFYLAQEAVEYIRNVRDTNRIQGIWWLKQFCPPADPGCTLIPTADYKIDATYSNFNQSPDGTPDSNAISLCPGAPAVCPVLLFDTAVNKLYGYGAGWTPTMYTRTVTMESVSDHEVKISVKVSWTTNLFSPVRTFTIQEYLLNF